MLGASGQKQRSLWWSGCMSEASPSLLPLFHTVCAAHKWPGAITQIDYQIWAAILDSRRPTLAQPFCYLWLAHPAPQPPSSSPLVPNRSLAGALSWRSMISTAWSRPPCPMPSHSLACCSVIQPPTSCAQFSHAQHFSCRSRSWLITQIDLVSHSSSHLPRPAIFLPAAHSSSPTASPVQLSRTQPFARGCISGLITEINDSGQPGAIHLTQPLSCPLLAHPVPSLSRLVLLSPTIWLWMPYHGYRFGLAAWTEHSTAWSCLPCSAILSPTACSPSLPAPLTQFSHAQHLLAGALRSIGQLSTSPNHSLAWCSLIQPPASLAWFSCPQPFSCGCLIWLITEIDLG